MADATVLKTVEGDLVRVRLPSSAPTNTDRRSVFLSVTRTIETTRETMQKAQWGAIYSLAFGYVMLTISQSIPVSLIPAFARDLQISEGFAGQTVTATSALAFVTSVVIASVARNMDRRGLYLVLAVTQVVANVLVAVAPNVWVLLLARMVLGVAVGALWSLAAAMSMRLVPPADVARAMSIVFGAGTIANVAPVPSPTWRRCPSAAWSRRLWAGVSCSAA